MIKMDSDVYWKLVLGFQNDLSLFDVISQKYSDFKRFLRVSAKNKDSYTVIETRTGEFLDENFILGNPEIIFKARGVMNESRIILNEKDLSFKSQILMNKTLDNYVYSFEPKIGFYLSTSQKEESLGDIEKSMMYLRNNP